MNRTTILIADDDPLFRSGLISILRAFPEFRILGDAATTEEVLRKVRSLQPEVVIMDSCLPGGDTIKTTSWIKQNYAGTKVIVIATTKAMDNLPDIIKAGADDYLLKGHLSIKGIVETINLPRRNEYPAAAAHRIASV